MKLPWDKLYIENPKFEYEIKSYPDNTKYVIVKKITNNLTFRLNTYEDLWILNQIHDVVKKANWNVTVTISNLIDAQADRRFDIAQPFGLKLVLEFLKGMGNFDYKIFHPHNPEVVEAILGDRVEIIDNSEFIDLVLAKGLMGEYTSETETQWDKILESKLIILFPDNGSFKWGMKLCDKLEWQGETYSASKSRKYENGKSVLTQIVDRQDFNGKDILIIDDLIIGGATFVGLAKLLKNRNCGKLYLAVSHITIDKPNSELFEHFHKVFTTNSKGLDYFCLNDNTERPCNLVVMELF